MQELTIKKKTMKLEHTKGEWRIEKGKSNGLIDESMAFAIYSDGWAIAAVWKDGNPDEVMQNAKLISAAPEMYRALRIAAKAANWKDYSKGSDYDTVRTILEKLES